MASTTMMKEGAGRSPGSLAATGSGAGILSSRWVLAVPACLALMYPFVLRLLAQSLQRVRRPDDLPVSIGWAGLGLALVLVSAVPAISLGFGHALGSLDGLSPRQLRARRFAHLAFAAPSLLVAIGNFASIFRMRSIVTSTWVWFWVGVIAFLLFGPVSSLTSIAERPLFVRRLRVVHGISAVGILAMFLLPHLSNHLTGLWSGDTHIRVMTALRTVYRSAATEPVLVTLLVVQMASGLVMFLWRVRMRSSNLFDTLQTMSGVYLAVFLTSHVTAAFSARWGQVDTNWNWLTNNGAGLLTGSSVALLPHYFLGPLLVMVHLACGVRSVLLSRAISREAADRFARGLIAVGALATIMISAGLLGVHLKP